MLTRRASLKTYEDFISQLCKALIDMPFVHLKTNVTKAKASASKVNAAISKALASALACPESYIMTHAELGVDIQFAKSDEVRRVILL